MISVRQLGKDTLSALRAGARLCPLCLGQGRLENVAAPDFGGDGAVRYVGCWKCGGLGLELYAPGTRGVLQ